MSIIVINLESNIILYDTDKQTSTIYDLQPNMGTYFRHQVSADNKYIMYHDEYVSGLVKLNNQYPFMITDQKMLDNYIANNHIYAFYCIKPEWHNPSDNVKFTNDSKYLIFCYRNKKFIKNNNDSINSLRYTNHYFYVFDIANKSICHISEYFMDIKKISVTDNSLLVQTNENIIVFDINTFTKLFTIPYYDGTLVNNILIDKYKIQTIDLSTGLNYQSSRKLNSTSHFDHLIIDNKLYIISVDKITTIDLDSKVETVHDTTFVYDKTIMYNLFVTDNKIYDYLK